MLSFALDINPAPLRWRFAATVPVSVTPVPRFIHFPLLALLYFAAAKIGALTVMPEGIAILWPPNGVLLAFLLRFGGRGYAGFAIMAIAAEVAADLPRFLLIEALLFGAINLAETTLALVLLSRWRFDWRFPTPSDLMKFMVAAPLLSALLAGACGAGVYGVFRGGETGYLEFLRIWWFGDALGLMIVTPLVLAAWRKTPVEAEPPERLHRADAIAGIAALATIGLLLGAGDRWLPGLAVGPMPVAPFVLFVAARFGRSETAAAVAGLALLTLFLMTRGGAPFGDVPVNIAVVRAQEFILTVSVMALGLSALLSQLRASQRRLEQANVELRLQADTLIERNLSLRGAEAEVVALHASLEQRVRDRTRELEESLAQVKQLRGLLPICAWCKKVRDDEDYWHSVDSYIAQRTEARFTHGICPDCATRFDGPDATPSDSTS